ncbi:unnamed protein product [Urochloa humidicola]
MPHTAGSGWLSRRRGGRHRRQEEEEGNGTATLPDDVLAAVFTVLTDGPSVLRCAATCRRWCGIVATNAAVLARLLPPNLARGRAFILVGGVAATARKRKRLISGCSSPAADEPQPCFAVPTAAASRLLGIRSGASISLTDGGSGHHGALLQLQHARPVASRNGWVVFELDLTDNDSLGLCVFNPMTGDTALLPPLHGEDRPRCYACALLTADDLHKPPPQRHASSFFRVLIVYNRSRFTALRAYSSDTGRWGAEVARSSGPKVDNVRLRKLGQGVVLCGVAYWPLRRSVLAVRLDGGPEPSEADAILPDDVPSDLPQNERQLGIVDVTHDAGGGERRRLCFVEASFDTGDDDDRLYRAGVPCRTIFLVTSVLTTVQGDLKWVRQEGRINLPETMMVRSLEAVNLRWFCERSGVILFTIGENSSCPGAYALDVTTREVEKVAGGAGCGSWRNVVGYEMGAADYLASLTCYQ